MPLIAERRVGEGALSGGEFGMKGRFDLTAGILGKPLVEQILEGDEIGQTLFGVLILSDSDIADLLFRENELQIVVHHDVLAAKAAQVFGHDAVDLAGLAAY